MPNSATVRAGPHWPRYAGRLKVPHCLNGTTFIGTSTTRANGDVTSLVLPGALRVAFTGHDVRWPDGQQLQRVGLIPDVEVGPTIAGIRGVRDEVLKRAVAFLKAYAGR